MNETFHEIAPWDEWSEVSSQQVVRMSDGEVVPAGTPFKMRHRRAHQNSNHILASELYSVPQWTARKLDGDDFMGEWHVSKGD